MCEIIYIISSDNLNTYIYTHIKRSILSDDHATVHPHESDFAIHFSTYASIPSVFVLPSHRRPSVQFSPPHCQNCQSILNSRLAIRFMRDKV